MSCGAARRGPGQVGGSSRCRALRGELPSRRGYIGVRDYSRPVSTATSASSLFEESSNPVAGQQWSGRVEVLRQVFRSDEDGYAVLAVRDASGDDFAVIGPVGHLNPGDRAEVTGVWQDHARYGPQLRASGALPLDPADREGRLAYLTSLRYIGPARAEALLERHGDDVLEAIARDPARVFGALRGLSARQAAAAAESWHSSRAVRDLHVGLAPHGLAHLAAAIHARFGADAMRVIHQDPYALTAVDGVGFARADTIALARDVPPGSDRRAQAAAAYALADAERS